MPVPCDEHCGPYSGQLSQQGYVTLRLLACLLCPPIEEVNQLQPDLHAVWGMQG